MFKVIATATMLSMAAAPVMANQAQDNVLSFILGVIVGNGTKPRTAPRPVPQHVHKPQYCVGKQWVRGSKVWVPEQTVWIVGHVRRNGTWKRGHWKTSGGYWTKTRGYYRTVKFRCD